MAWRIFTASWSHVWRNLWIGLATVIVFTVALLSVNVLIATNVLLERAVTFIEDRVDVTVLFQPNTPQGVLDQAKFYLTSLPQTQYAKIITADEALVAFKERSKGNQKVLDALGELPGNPLGAELVIKANDSSDYPFLLDAVRNPQYLPFIHTSSYEDHRDAISWIQDAARSLRLFGSALVAIFVFFGLLAAFNAIRVAIYTQRDEIAIMRLVGASSAYIRWPFVLEGVWLAAFASVFTAICVGLGIVYGEPILSRFFGMDVGLQSFYLRQGAILVLAEFGTIAALSGFVSWIAAGRYIKR
ncbi:MAG: permease-like cell division protein FtsX [Candidatus Uhrbacteria bacterium]